jgi:hypothetical protein
MRKCLLVAVVAVLAAGSGCCWTRGSVDWDRLLPRESPRMAAARFQLALVLGEAGDSFESLTKASQEIIGYTVWWLFMPGQKDPDTGETYFNIMTESAVDGWLEMSETEAQVFTYYPKVKWSYSIQMRLEDDEWKVGLLESFRPDMVKEYEAKHEAKGEETPPEPAP